MLGWNEPGTEDVDGQRHENFWQEWPANAASDDIAAELGEDTRKVVNSPGTIGRVKDEDALRQLAPSSGGQGRRIDFAKLSHRRCILRHNIKSDPHGSGNLGDAQGAFLNR